MRPARRVADEVESLGDDRAAPQDEDELETAAPGVMYVADDFLADPPDAPKHVVRDLEAWLCEPALLCS